MQQAYPLCWPAGWQRTPNPGRSRFSPTFGNSRDAIINEIRLMGGKDPIISTNIPLKRDGLPYAGQKQPTDKGVAVYFTYKKQQVVLACDKWDKIEDNLWAIKKTIEAMRGVERWGVSDMLSRAFTGFTALPENSNKPAVETCWEILGIPSTSSKEEIKLAWQTLIKKYHPDNPTTGNQTMFLKVQEAYEIAYYIAN